MQKIRNVTILKYGLIAAAICFFISLFVYMQFSIDEAVFLKHYYDMEINRNINMDIHVITNSSDTRKIDEIKFPQMPEDFAYVHIGNINYHFGNGYYTTEKFTHYNYNILSLAFQPINSYQDDNDEELAVLDKAIIKYNNGDEQEVNIGKIVLRKNSKQTESLTSTYVGAFNDNLSTSVFISNDNLIINSITSNLDEEIKDIFTLSLNGKNVSQLNYPVHVTSDDSLTFDSQFKFAPQDMRKYNVYEIQKRIILTDSEGNQESMRILNLDYQPADIFLKEKDIVQYFKEIGVK